MNDPLQCIYDWTMASMSKAEYLKKYLSDGVEMEKKKKKKKKIKTSQAKVRRYNTQ